VVVAAVTACTPDYGWEAVKMEAQATGWHSKWNPPHLPGPEPDENIFLALGESTNGTRGVDGGPEEDAPVPAQPPSTAVTNTMSAASAEATAGMEASLAELQAASTCCHREWIYDLDILTFSIYFTERATRWICDAGPVSLSLIAGASLVVNKWIAIIGAVYGPIFEKACKARSRTNCLRIRMTWGATPIGWYDVESHDRKCRVDWRSV
jgi:hypothetical protein